MTDTERSVPETGGPWPGAALALGSAVLFGAAVPAAKLLLDGLDAWLLAGLLYLGAGLGLAAVRALGHGRDRAAAMHGSDWVWLGGAIAMGGVVGPVLLMIGLERTPASSTALLLNLEGVLTAAIAWVVFRENVDRRIALGMAAIVAGAVVLTWPSDITLAGLIGPLAIAGACLAWALDNNLTRRVALGDPVQIAMLKGLVAGTVNTALAFTLGATMPTGAGALAAAAVVGFLGYGVSLVLFVLALRHLGTARTGAYYGVAPFVGAFIGIIVLGDAVDAALLVAGALMALGVTLHLAERHRHEHTHEPTHHAHRHVHDTHHRHDHGPGDPVGEPHTHAHDHGALRHLHAHYPDAHHRHRH